MKNQWKVKASAPPATKPNQCCACTFWSEKYRGMYDAGTTALCERLSSGKGACPSVEGTLVSCDGHSDEPFYLNTRWDFCCSEFNQK